MVVVVTSNIRVFVKVPTVSVLPPSQLDEATFLVGPFFFPLVK